MDMWMITGIERLGRDRVLGCCFGEMLTEELPLLKGAEKTSETHKRGVVKSEE